MGKEEMPMKTLLIRERYKVICALYAEESYAALQAVDIQSREKKPCLLNVYEGAQLKRYIRCFHDLHNCDSYLEMFIWKESLVTVFEYRKGRSIDQVFFKGATVDWPFRLRAAQALFHQALSMAAFPPEISCAALLSDNIQVFPEEKGLWINYEIHPLEEMNERELVFLLTDQIQKVLPCRWDSPRRERRFVRELCTGSDHSVAAVYGKWVAAEPEIRAEYEQMESKGALSRALSLLWMNLGDWVKTHFGKKRRSG